LVRAAFAEALHLAVDDRWVDGTDDVGTQAQALDRTRREIFHEHVGLLRQILDDLQALRVLQIDRDGFLVGVEQQEVGIVLAWIGAEGASRIAGFWVLHLHHFGPEPSESFGAGWAGLELSQIQHPHAGQAGLATAACAHMHVPPLPACRSGGSRPVETLPRTPALGKPQAGQATTRSPSCRPDRAPSAGTRRTAITAWSLLGADRNTEQAPGVYLIG